MQKHNQIGCNPIFPRITISAVLVAGAAISFPTMSLAEDKASWQSWIETGNQNLDLQRLDKAEECFKQAVKLVEGSKHSPDDLVKAYERLASTYVLENKTDGDNEAIAIYHKSLQVLEKTYGKGSPKLVPTLFSLGSIFEAQGDPEIALGIYKRALAINEKNYGPTSPAVANTLHRLGRASFKAGRADEAEHNYRSSLSILSQEGGLKASKELESLLADYNDLLRKSDNSDKSLVSAFQNEVLRDKQNNSASVQVDSTSAFQKQDAATSHLDNKAQNNEDAKVLSRGFKQPFSNSTLKTAYATMSEVLHFQHPLRESEEYYERAIAIDLKALGPNHPAVADDITGLAMLYISQNRNADAKPLLTRALSIYTNVYGDDNMMVTRTKAYLATVCKNLGEPQQAVAIYNDTLNKERLTTEPNDIGTARMLNELAYLYYRQGKLEDACTMYQWALASTEGALGAQSPLVDACLSDYADVLRSLGRNSEAERLLEDRSRSRIKAANK